MENKRLELIKILLGYIFEKNRQEEEFEDYINENNKLFHIDISPIVDIPIYEIAEVIGIQDEKQAEEIFEFFDRTDKSVDELIKEFCKKYNI